MGFIMCFCPLKNPSYFFVTLGQHVQYKVAKKYNKNIGKQKKYNKHLKIKLG